RALAGRPSVTFADEPTGALDQTTGRAVLQILVDSTRDSGASLAAVTHDGSVAAASRRTVTIQDGRIPHQVVRPAASTASTAATAIMATVVGGAAGFVGRMPTDSAMPMEGEASVMPFLVICAITASALLLPSAVGLGGSAARLSLARREKDLATTRLVGGTSA